MPDYQNTSYAASYRDYAVVEAQCPVLLVSERKKLADGRVWDTWLRAIVRVAASSTQQEAKYSQSR